VFLQVLDNILEIAKLGDFSLIGHRVVHGGELYKSATKIKKDTLINLESLNNLAPLHNPIQLSAIQRCLKVFPSIPQGASFDTAFYATMPDYSYLYPVPYEWYSQHKVRRYGFHGLSHDYVVSKACELIGRSAEDTNVISCHLGAGCSVTATKGGVAMDTSMGFTPLSGVMMGSRSGDVDPTILTFIAAGLNVTVEEVLRQLNNESGLKGITGSPDSLNAENLYLKKDKMGTLAVEMFCYSIAKYIASYLATLGRIDCLVFTGGIGEKSSVKRGLILQYLSGLEIVCDNELNISHGSSMNGCISSENSKIPVYVISTNEELVIAQQTEQLYKL